MNNNTGNRQLIYLNRKKLLNVKPYSKSKQISHCIDIIHILRIDIYRRTQLYGL